MAADPADHLVTHTRGREGALPLPNNPNNHLTLTLDP